jgi:hypothetical protein
MSDRVSSVFLGIVGNVGTAGAMGIITDISVALCLAFIGGLLGYFGNVVAKWLHKKIKG